MNIQLTVYFDDPFWVGVFERTDEGMLEICRVVFGSEPKNYEIYQYVLENYFQLRFSSPVWAGESRENKINPKRLQRIAHRETLKKGIGTKAQQAMQLEYETRKQENKKHSKEVQEELDELKFQMRQEKKKEKKKGH